eukprot:TRINITY_DN8921_c0_g1_i1.p1 TRINITY_DN8921_c0_g1~~TRINITY_DN8921_c0_g1_i1.p1  ORF type:complete len:192 (-),score=21.04 TRINITY_DN8921_c0_g1_i1:174-749(-)
MLQELDSMGQNIGSTIAKEINNIDKDGSGSIEFDEFMELNRRFPHLLWPVYRLQHRMRTHTISVDFWKRHQTHLFGAQNNRSVEAVMELKKERKKKSADNHSIFHPDDRSPLSVRRSAAAPPLQIHARTVMPTTRSLPNTLIPKPRRENELFILEDDMGGGLKKISDTPVHHTKKWNFDSFLVDGRHKDNH